MQMQISNIIGHIMDLFIGIGAGILSTMTIEKMRAEPNLYICSEIAKSKKNKYNVKIINRSKDDAYNIIGYIRYSDSETNKYYVVRWTETPIIRGTKEYSQKEQECVAKINPMKIGKDKLISIQQSCAIKDLYLKKKLSVDYFFREESYVQSENRIRTGIDIIISATNARTGKQKIFTQQLQKIVLGKWEIGKENVSPYDANDSSEIG